MELDEKLQAEDYAAIGQAAFPEGKYAFARKRGVMHLVNETVCQDYFLCDAHTEGLFLTAVADGHGASDYIFSDTGARLACETAVRLLRNAYLCSKSEDAFLSAVCSDAFRRCLLDEWEAAVLSDYAERKRQDASLADGTRRRIIQKYGTTLMFAAVSSRYITVGQIGDGGVLLFDRCGNRQLMVRALEKQSSATDSLVLSRAAYSFRLEAFPKQKFDGVFLSTDGIFDRLTAAGLYKYVMRLVGETEQGIFTEAPFLFKTEKETFDLYRMSKDDCTVTLVLLDHPAEQDACETLAEKAFFANGWERILREADVYFVEKDDEQFQVHVFPSETRLTMPELYLPDVTVLSAEETFTDGQGRFCVVYPEFEDVSELSRLIEVGMHMEHGYPVGGEHIPFGNCWWLHMLETLLNVQDALRVQGLQLSALQLKTACADSDGRLLLYSDGFAPLESDADRAAWAFFRSNLALIGKLLTGQEEIPLFAAPTADPADDTQIIYIPNPERKGIYLRVCRTRLTQNGEHYLENCGKYEWSITAAKGAEQIVKPGEWLKIGRNLSFRMMTDMLEIPFQVVLLKDRAVDAE